MGPIDPEGSDTKAIVAASPSSGASSLNVATTDEIASTTITITGTEGSHQHQNNGQAAAGGGTAPSAPPLLAPAPGAPPGVIAGLGGVTTPTSSATAPTSGAAAATSAAGPTAPHVQTSGYSTVYLNNRNYNILSGGKT